MRIKQRGYFTLSTPEGDKVAHFSRTFISVLQEITGKDITTWGKDLTKIEDNLDQFDAITDLFYAGAKAYCLEEDLEIDFNIYKAGNWVWNAVQEDENLVVEIMDALQEALPKVGKTKGKKKS